MQNYTLTLESKASDSFRCNVAAQSQDIDVIKKLKHNFNINADIDTDYNVGLIVGASGSGKTTFAEKFIGISKNVLDLEIPIVEQFHEKYTYEECADFLLSVGLSSVPCWIRPAKTLSNGQKFRAEVALQIANTDGIICVDEWTSVVDRTVAKIMSHAIQKFARKQNRKIVLLSCHYDIIEWLLPDWVIDCNTQSYEERRLLRQSRTEQLEFVIAETTSETWKYFSKYHYLSDRLPGGKNYIFGVYYNDVQIGFQCFSNYVPIKKGAVPIYHSNRTVIHPDYVGIGLGMKVIDATSKYMKDDYGFVIMGKFSNKAIYESMKKNPKWVLTQTQTQTPGGNMIRKTGFRNRVRTYSFKYVG